MQSIFRILVGTVAVVALTVSAASAKNLLRANSQWPEVHTGSETDKWWAEQVKKRTNGEVEIKLFFSGALGKAEENLKLLREGAIDIALMSPGYFPSELPFHAAPNSIPMAMAKTEEGTDLMLRLMKEVPAFEEEARVNGMKTLFFHHLNPYKLVCKEPITSVEQMKGKKMRTWGEPLPKSVKAVGGTPLTMFMPEIYEGLSRGVVDCIPTSTDQVLNFKWYEVAKYVMDITIWVGPTNATWISLNAWNKLTPAQQKILQEASIEAMKKDRDSTIASGKEADKALKEKGVKFLDFPDAEKKKWQKANPDFFAEFVAAMEKKGKGDDARKTVKIWREVSSVFK